MFKKMKKVEKDERKQKKINSPLYRKWHCVMMIKLTVAFWILVKCFGVSSELWKCEVHVIRKKYYNKKMTMRKGIKI